MFEGPPDPGAPELRDTETSESRGPVPCKLCDFGKITQTVFFCSKIKKWKYVSKADKNRALGAETLSAGRSR